MYNLLFSLLLLLFSLTALPQGKLASPHKPPIDSAAIVSWPSIMNPQISGDGLFVSYWINNQPVGGKTLIVQPVDHSWKKEFINADNGFFSADSRTFVIFRQDSLYFLTLGNEHLEHIAGIISFQSFPFQASEWLLFRIKGSRQDLILLNLSTGEKKIFRDVDNYWYDLKFTVLLTELLQTQPGSYLHQLQCQNLATNKIETVWSTEDSAIAVQNAEFDTAGKGLILTLKDKGKTSILYYRLGENSTPKKIIDESIDMQGWSMAAGTRFSTDGENVLCSFAKKIDNPKPYTNSASVDIYSYKDSVLPNHQPTKNQIQVQAIFNLQSEKMVALQNQGEKILANNSKYMLVSNRDLSTKQDWPWWPSLKNEKIWLVSLKDGSRKELNPSLNDSYFYPSPDDRYFVYIDWKTSGYFSYDTYSRTSKKISWTIPDQWLHMENQDVAGLHIPVGIAGWSSTGEHIFVYDQYDIWQLDISGIHPPVNITKGFGRQHHIKFRIVDDGIEKKYTRNADILLTAFDAMTKYNGFYRLQLGVNARPEFLTMDACTYYRTANQKPHYYSFNDGLRPIKAANSNTWITQRQTAASAPDYCITRNFLDFEAFTDVHPEKQYNWLTAELVFYPELDNTISQGILYKPADFDPTKKYPIIFNYYEQLSHRLYEFPKPGFSMDNINIPWFVSRGYLVFTPDIHFKMAVLSGRVVGDYAVSSIVGAARYLSKRPYIDKNRMGIQGHSFGGGETLYLITHTSLFAAACAAAPTVSDELSSTLGFNRGNKDYLIDGRFFHAEKGHDQIGASPWQRMDLYLRASPLLKADKITIPLLLMHNHKDGAVDWNQGAMMYMALRRLQKPVWMLQYDNGVHSVFGMDAIDYTIRMTQFFDYFLKNALPPKWMTIGVPRRLKGIDSGFELDNSGRLP